MDDPRQYSPAAARNRAPILDLLRRILPQGAKVLEIGSGSGEHAVFFAAARPDLAWFPSDPDPRARASIAAWIATDGVANVRAPRDIDVRAARWSVEDEGPFDAIISCNMVHIAPWSCALGLMAGAERLMRGGGVLFLYGPFKREGAHTAASNEAFDASLKARNAEWGVRDMEAVVDIAKQRGFACEDVVAMPANNFSLVFRKEAQSRATSR
ncbi:MAG TPA: DUF938 domain-containing protein [Caulobacterales bacterium]|nr:DUF938 domain-containing protein [Caulobacterales bacterium]